MPIQPGYEGFAALGDMLGGGATNRAEANAPKYMSAAANAAYKYNQAARERSLALIAAARLGHVEGLPAAVAGVYKDPAEAAFNTAVLGSAETPNARNLGVFQTPGYTALVAEQQDALAKGDFKRANATTAVLGGDAIEPFSVEAGGKLVFDPVTGEANMTPLGTADVDATNALTARRNRPPVPRAMKPYHMPVSELKFHAERIENDLGRRLTESELRDLAAGNLNIEAPLGASGAPHRAEPHALPPAHGARRHPPVPAAAVEALRRNPALRDQFAEKYGDEAARVAMGR